MDLNSTIDDAQPIDINVAEYIRHPNYKPPSRYNDIALIRLETPVTFNDYIKPICLETKARIPDNILKATGWGKLSYSGESSSILQVVVLDHYNETECKEHYADVSIRLLANGVDYTRQICAGGREVVSDTCQGDSGGPLISSNENFNKVTNLAGITSFGSGCGIKNLPAVYTRVSNYVPWIEDIVWPND